MLVCLRMVLLHRGVASSSTPSGILCARLKCIGTHTCMFQTGTLRHRLWHATYANQNSRTKISSYNTIYRAKYVHAHTVQGGEVSSGEIGGKSHGWTVGVKGFFML